MYILLKDNRIEKYPYTIDLLKMENPNTSFPNVIGDSTLSYFNVYPVLHTQPPVVDYTKNVIEVDPILVGSDWKQEWRIEDASDAEKKERIDFAWMNLRKDRNKMLSECDWTQGKDIPDDVSINWALYRQELRNLPQNTIDPFNPTWPNKPE